MTSRTLRNWHAIGWLVLLVLGGIAMLIAPAHAQAANDVTFTLTTNSPDGASLVPKLTWSATPAIAGTPCVGSGDAAWNGAKAASGTVTLPAVTVSKAYTLVCTWPGQSTFTVTWTAPTTNTDGSPLTDLAKYVVKYGQSNTPAGLTAEGTVSPPLALTWTSPAGLAAGNWYAAVIAVNASGVQSDLSNIAAKSITAAASVTRTQTLGFKVPSPPVVQ